MRQPPGASALLLDDIDGRMFDSEAREASTDVGVECRVVRHDPNKIRRHPLDDLVPIETIQEVGRHDLDAAPIGPGRW